MRSVSRLSRDILNVLMDKNQNGRIEEASRKPVPLRYIYYVMQVKKIIFTLSQTLQDKNIEENVTQPDKTSVKKNIY